MRQQKCCQGWDFHGNPTEALEYEEKILPWICAIQFLASVTQGDTKPLESRLGGPLQWLGGLSHI